MLGLQLDEQVGVLRADRVGVIEREVVRKRQPDVIADALQLVGRHHRANRALDVIDHVFGVLDAGPGRHPHVQAHHAGIDAGKEILADHQQHRQRRQDQHGDADQ